VWTPTFVKQPKELIFIFGILPIEEYAAIRSSNSLSNFLTSFLELSVMSLDPIKHKKLFSIQMHHKAMPQVQTKLT
jgi:hypothetical protein